MGGPPLPDVLLFNCCKERHTGVVCWVTECSERLNRPCGLSGWQQGESSHTRLAQLSKVADHEALVQCQARQRPSTHLTVHSIPAGNVQHSSFPLGTSGCMATSLHVPCSGTCRSSSPLLHVPNTHQTLRTVRQLSTCPSEGCAGAGVWGGGAGSQNSEPHSPPWEGWSCQGGDRPARLSITRGEVK